MAIAAREHWQALELCSPNRLQETFQVPSLHKHGTEPTLPKTLANVGRVAAPEVVRPRPPCHIAKELMRVSGKQSYIPFEFDAEPSLRLVGWRRTMEEKNDEIDSPSERAKERRVILDRM
jgi:hypothetical protein